MAQVSEQAGRVPAPLRSTATILRRTIILIGSAALLLAGASAHATGEGATVEHKPMGWHMQSGNPHMSPVGEGAVAQLRRNENGISYSIRTNQLRAGHAYTVWVVVINNPAACRATPCAPADILQRPETNAQVTYGTGNVVGSSGEGGFGGALKRGPLPDGWLADRGLEDPLGAEVHLVLNDHGPVIPELMPEMIHTYRAGCTDESLPAIFPATAKADGTPGPNTCRLRQVVVFD